MRDDRGFCSSSFVLRASFFVSGSKSAPSFPLPWERVLWSARPGTLSAAARRGERYDVTDFRVVRRSNRHDRTREIALHDIDGLELTETFAQRLIQRSTVVIRSRRHGEEPLVFADVRRGRRLTFILHLLTSGSSGREVDRALARGDLVEPPPDPFPPPRPHAAIAPGFVVLVMGAIAIGLHGDQLPVAYPADDAIYPGGRKKSRAEIVAFMEQEVLPLARIVLAPVEDGPNGVTCFTCHGPDPEAIDWRMPAVRALPEPALRKAGIETHAHTSDPQLRNAVYGYLAQEQKQQTAVYMRRVVMPGMARLLNRPPYDFTRSYTYNRSRAAFGCYHCHRAGPG